MSWRERVALWVRPVLYLGQNPLSLAGAALTTSAGLTMVALWLLEVVGGAPSHAYGTGIALFLALPAMFVAGLLLIPVGVLLRRRRLRRTGQLPVTYPSFDLSRPVLRNGLALFALATLLNVAIVGTGTYRALHYMDSVEFCGTACHSVMQPEHAAYKDSPHSRVACVACHIGPGASWFVKSKLSGARQVAAVALETYSRPIPSPVRELRPARETCEQCHWPRKFHGDKLVVKTKFADDEANTRSVTVLMLRIGGHGANGRVGIHGRHLDETERIEYVSRDRRQTISHVTYLDDEGRTVQYVAEEQAAAGAALPADGEQGGAEKRRMDCMDCHNRPTHAFPLPERALDQALAEGRISTELPFVKKTAVELLRASHASREAAGPAIEAGLAAFYREKYPQVAAQKGQLVAAAAREVREIYMRNVFPSMKVGWGTYPNNIGHEDFPGCFRCHDDRHRAADGRLITQDCEACHAVLAMEETDPKVLGDLGLK
ncbi:MAG TPA: NapC/NirT family cytochrome c [Vicinamibacteria bacterium]|nr:NapC/NirT family cytochrome c [Vicinamibacteria bacterium]